MNKQEAYNELLTRTKHINELIELAHAFANQHELQMGQSRYSPEEFEVVNPETGRPDSYTDDYDEEWTFDADEEWIGSSVCW